MLFVKTDDLKKGMRIARPIYNKNGVLLYERDSRLTEQSIVSIRNFGLIGIFILEPAEPVPPMSSDDIEFERFQTVNVYALEDELHKMINTKRSHRIEFIANAIIKSYGHLDRKINFIQNLRSKEDYIYKHSLNMAILCAMMTHKMNVKIEEQLDTILACLTHDIGRLMIPPHLLDGEDSIERERLLVNSQVTGFEFLENIFSVNPNVKRICSQTQKVLSDFEVGKMPDNMKLFTGARVMLIAETFDKMTAMNISMEPSSEVKALKYLLQNPEIFNKKAVEALTDSIHFLGAGTSVELSTGDKALVLVHNPRNILRPTVLCFSNNRIIDLGDERMYGDLEIVDIMKTMDNRYVMDTDSLKKFGISANE